MPLQYVGGKTGAWAGSTSTGGSISLTTLTGGIASSAQAGDIVIAAYASASDPAAANKTLSIKDPAGVEYPLIRAGIYNASSVDTYLRIAYKVLTAGDTSVVFGPTLSSSDAGAVAFHVWRGVDTSAPLDVAAVNGSSVFPRPNPPAITPVTQGAVIIAVGSAATNVLGTQTVFGAASLQNFITAASSDYYSAVVGIGSVFWSGTGAIDLPEWSDGTTDGSGDSLATTLALRPAPTPTTQTLTPSLFTNSGSFYAPTATAGPVNLSPSLLTNSGSFYAATVEQGAALLLLPLVDTQAALYAPAVATGARVLAPPLLSSAAAVYAPAVSTGSVSLLPTLVTGDSVFLAPAVVAGGLLLLPSQINNAQTFFAPKVLGGASLIVPAVLVNSQEFRSALVKPGAVNLSPSLINQAQQFYAFQVKDRLIIHFGNVFAQVAFEQIDVLVLVDEVKATWIDPSYD